MQRTNLLKFLKGEANKQKTVRLTLREIASEMDLSFSYIRLLLGELEALGKIEVVRSKNRRNIIKLI